MGVKCQASALVQQGVVIAAGGRLTQRLSGGHQQALGQMTGAQTGLFTKVLRPVHLSQQGPSQ